MLVNSTWEQHMADSYDEELGGFEKGCVRQTGSFCWVLLGLVAFTILLSYVPVAGVTDVPHYARTIMYLSLGYHFDDVAEHLASTSPPPPAFRLL